MDWKFSVNFNPNYENPDEATDEFNPNEEKFDEMPGSDPEGNSNPDSSGTVTITVPYEPDQELETEPEIDPEKDLELVYPDGEQMPPADPQEVTIINPKFSIY